MKKIITLMLTLLLAFTACVGLTACNKGSTVNPRNNEIVVGYTDYAPMNYTENGVFKGFDTELAIMTFEALGYNVRFKLIDWSNKYVELGKTVDCVWNGFTSNGSDDTTDDGIDNPVSRAQLVDFSYDYMQNAQCIIRLANSPAISSPTDFAGKKVAFELGSSGESLVSSYKAGATEDASDDVNLMPQGCTSQMDAVQKVAQGACEYAVVDVLLAQAVIGGGGYAGLTINEGLDIAVEYYAVAFKKGSPLVEKVNIMFEAFAKTGYLNTLATKYNLATSVITDFSSQK